MENDQARFFDERTAAVYDDLPNGDPNAAVEFLASLAKGGVALELAIGTGRIALPLVAQGVRVDGIDISTAMVARLRAKPGGDQLDVTIGDFADVAVVGTYALVYLVFNTLFNLGTQPDQVRCFENVASHLADDGVFVVEAMTPNSLFRLRNDQYVDAELVDAEGVVLDLLRHDAVTQTIEENHVSISESGIRLFPVKQRYAWPSELDLMAQMAGLRLRERWGGWKREPFTAASDTHISVYGR